ncbi:NAD(P)H-quinone oxidoreductase [Paenibacillus sp. HB172176]|uniref:NAD(P)H-quinone oxidoreductase n=1 Tax=Paenibacillus sp. HB172176 TaxID=2493690 RepID=UPI001438E6AA|nr:NAD(P)H-quinone oxidoreductase [Paenibacillus sp. HB172176]
MRAIMQDEKTKKLAVGQAEEPDPSYGDLLVSVRATALNRADLLQKKGVYPPPPGASNVLGLEMAGVVEEDCGAWRAGDRVMALLPGGGYAERVRIPAGMAMPIPAALSFEEAAGIPEAFLTAYLNMFQLGGLKAGQTALIHAGASGVGTAAIQLAKSSGVQALATAGSEEKLAICSELGALQAFNYHDGPFLEKVLDATGGSGANVILDFIGASYWEQNLSALALDGRLIIIGTLGGSQIPGLHLGQLLMRRLQIIGTTLRTLSLERKRKLTAEFSSFALPRFASGTMKPVVDSIWSWHEIEEAHEHMANNRNIGKIIVRIEN